MNIKKIVVVGDDPVAIRFEPLKMMLTLGGSVKAYPVISTVLSTYFKIEEPNAIKVMSGKCRFVVTNCRRSMFEKGIESLNGEGITLTDVNNFGRIMR